MILRDCPAPKLTGLVMALLGDNLSVVNTSSGVSIRTDPYFSFVAGSALTPFPLTVTIASSKLQDAADDRAAAPRSQKVVNARIVGNWWY